MADALAKAGYFIKEPVKFKSGRTTVGLKNWVSKVCTFRFHSHPQNHTFLLKDNGERTMKELEELRFRNSSREEDRIQE